MKRTTRWPRRIGVTLLLSVAGGCLGAFPPRQRIVAEPTLDPTRFFAGHTHGEGTLDLRVGTDRTLTVEGMGRTEADGTFRLDQTITYGDGAVETRVWRLRRVQIGAPRLLRDLAAEEPARDAPARWLWHRHPRRHPTLDALLRPVILWPVLHRR